MALSLSTIPMRWPSGPLETARRSKSEGFSPAVRQALERWHDPAALDILKGSPVDCIVISWAGGLPEDAAQQKTAAALIVEARHRGIAIVGWVDGHADPAAAIASAKSAGLDAVGIEGFTGKADFPVIAWGEGAKAPWDAPSPLLAVTGNLWPGVRVTTPAAGAAADVESGPTAVPWLDSNGWCVQLARARVNKPVWMLFDPPGKGAVIPAQAYTLAVCDTEAAGGRWVISLDDNLRAGLGAGNAAAQASWQEVTSATAFFARHRAWRDFRSLGLVGVISDFTGAHYDLSAEILNLMARRDLLFRVLWRSRAIAEPFTGLKALVYADEVPPEPALRQKMLDFAGQGGLLVAGPKWGSEGKPLSGAAAHSRFDVRSVGKGRLAVAKEDLLDPFEIAGDVNLLVGYANNLVKYYNSSSSGCSHYTVSPDGKSALLQGLNFGTSRQGGVRTVWLRDKHRGARLWSIGSESAVPMQAFPAEDFPGEEYRLPLGAAPGYVALEFDV